jgi:hypothetical protein
MHLPSCREKAQSFVCLHTLSNGKGSQTWPVQSAHERRLPGRRRPRGGSSGGPAPAVPCVEWRRQPERPASVRRRSRQHSFPPCLLPRTNPGLFYCCACAEAAAHELSTAPLALLALLQRRSRAPRAVPAPPAVTMPLWAVFARHGRATTFGAQPFAGTTGIASVYDYCNDLFAGLGLGGAPSHLESL